MPQSVHTIAGLIFGPKKLQNMVAIFMIMVFAMVMAYTRDTLKPTRLELETFFATELPDCQITSLIEREYPGNKGNYKLFRTDCSSEYFPILLESGYEDYGRFVEGLIVNKKANSVNLTLTGSNSVIKLKILHPSDEDDRILLMKFFFIFFGSALLIMVFIPNSFWERN